MNYQRKTLLAGIAVLALAAGTGLAPAQETPKNQGSQSKPPHATQQMNQAPAGKTGQSAQDRNRGATGRDETKAGKSAKDGDRSAHGHERNGPAAQQQNQGGNNAAAQRGGMQGLQGNATGMNVKLTDEQRTRIRDTVIRASGAPRVGRVRLRRHGWHCHSAGPHPGRRSARNAGTDRAGMARLPVFRLRRRGSHRQSE